MLAALVLASLAGSDPTFNFVAVFVFGSFAMPMFSLSAAHANDRADKGEFVLVNAALMLFYSIGAIVGPLTASFVMEAIRPQLRCSSSAPAVYAALVARNPLPHAGAWSGARPQPLHRATTHVNDLRTARQAVNGGDKRDEAVA